MSTQADECPIPLKKTKHEEEIETEGLPLEKQNELDVALLNAGKENNIDEIVKLISEGADVTYQEDLNGTSALMLVAAHGNCDAIRKLLQAGAVWNAVDRKHKCAGDYATDVCHQVKNMYN